VDITGTIFTNATLLNVKSSGITHSANDPPVFTIGSGYRINSGFLVGPSVDLSGESMAGIDLSGENLTYSGDFFSCTDAHLDPPAQQKPRPPVFIGGKGDKVLATVADVADGWNTCWVWKPEDYRARANVLDRACESIDRDPKSVVRSIGLYALVGENESDLAARFERLRAVTPAGVLDSVSLDQWRQGRLVGTAEQVREQVAVWAELGVETIILGAGALPFQVGALEDVAALSEALKDI
jgi:alkanesulfonate monooxygenase SsuD/methylene tetrahydromethanopterin reductase-like flavin-dependent oxidoreductase (luciferase family)